jgi:tellurite resistance protein
MAEDLVQLEHVFRAAVLASFADGKPGAEELKLLGEILQLYPDFARLRKPRELVIETYQLIKQHGEAALLDQIAAGLPDRAYQELAFTLASKIVSADGVTERGEAMMLGELQERFGFTPEDVLRLLAS